MEEKNKQGFTGVWIPEYIFNNKDLNVSEKFVWAYIASFSGSKLKCCIQSNETIAERLGISEPTVSRSIATLKKAGYIFVIFKNNNNAKRQLFSVDESPKKTAFRLKNESNQNDKTAKGSNQNDLESNQNDKTANSGESYQNDYHRINKNKERINTASSATAGQTPAEQAIVEDAPEVPEGYVVVDPKYDEYGARELFGDAIEVEVDEKTLAKIKKSKWYLRSKSKTVENCLFYMGD